MTMARQGG